MKDSVPAEPVVLPARPRPARRARGGSAGILFALLLLVVIGLSAPPVRGTPLGGVGGPPPIPTVAPLRPATTAAGMAVGFAAGSAPGVLKGPASSGGCAVLGREPTCSLLRSGVVLTGSAGNSSPVPEVGAPLAELPFGGFPSALLVDSVSGITYLANPGADSVDAYRTGSLLAAIPVGTDPSALAEDAVRELVYVVNSGSENLTVLSGAERIATIAVGADPTAEAWDASNGWLYVANSYSATVSVVNGTERTATIQVPGDPSAVAYDADRGWIYVVEPGTGSVSILNGTHLVRTVTGLDDPTGEVADGPWVYVIDSDPGEVTVFNGSGAVGNLTGLGANSMVVGPQGLLDVAEGSADRVVVVDGSSVEAEVNLSSAPGALAFDRVTGRLYAALPASREIAAIDGVRCVGVADLPYAPSLLGFDPTGAILVGAGPVPAPATGGTIEFLSTLLATGGLAVSPSGDPAGSVDVGTPERLNASIWATGNGTDRSSIDVEPSTGLACPTVPEGTSEFGTLALGFECTPEAAGQYAVTVNVTDAGGNSVWSRADLQVFSTPRSAVPVAEVDGAAGATYAYLNSTVTFRASVLGGTGSYAPFSWTGLPPGSCRAVNGTAVTCLVLGAGRFELSASTRDSNGIPAASPPLAFDIFAPPSVQGAPAATQASADVDQMVGFASNGTVGTGGAPAISWSGLPGPACTSLQGAHIDCALAQPGSYLVVAAVTDANGRTVDSPALDFTVYSDPTIPAAPQANRSSVDAGQPFRLLAAVEGGFDNDTFLWSGLPASCGGLTGANPVCVDPTPGVLTVAAQAIDSNGGVSAPSRLLLLTVYPDLAAAAPTLSQGTVAVGGEVTLTAGASGGDGVTSFSWLGLPPGCSVSGATARCEPSSPGAFLISVVAVDANGARAESPEAGLLVTGPAARSAPPPAPVPASVTALGVVLAAAAVALAVAGARSRRVRRTDLPEFEVVWEPGRGGPADRSHGPR